MGNTVYGFCRQNSRGIKMIMSQSVVDLILFFYARRRILSVKYDKNNKGQWDSVFLWEKKSISICPISDTWGDVTKYLLRAFTIPVDSIDADGGSVRGTDCVVTKENWKGFDWNEAK